MNALRVIFGILVGAVALTASIVSIVHVQRMPSRDVLPDIAYNELTKAAIDVELDQSKTLYQVGLLAIGAVVGISITNKKEAALVLSDWPEIFMSACSLLLLLGSFGFYLFHLSQVQDAYAMAGRVNDAGLKSMPDVFSRGIEGLYDVQMLYLLTGLFSAGCALFSAHKLK